MDKKVVPITPPSSVSCPGSHHLTAPDLLIGFLSPHWSPKFHIRVIQEARFGEAGTGGALAATVCNTPPPGRALSVSPELVAWEEKAKTANQRSIQETSRSGRSLSSHHAVFQSLHIAESSGLALFLLSANPFQKPTRECK